MDRAEFLENIIEFKKNHRFLPHILALIVLLAYGGRIIHDNIFVDSELMMLRPYHMQKIWLGSNRFGLVLTSRLFGMGRLIPWLSAFLMALMMWGCGMALSFCAWVWSGKNKHYRSFCYLFPLLHVTAPVFAGQYLFILQAFEISFGLLLCILAAFCVGNFVYHKGWWWLVLGLGLMIWGFGSYQAMIPFYISLVLGSFLLVYINAGRASEAFGWGIKHCMIFVAGIVLYGGIAAAIKWIIGSESAYVSNLIHWKSDGWRMCLQNIWLDLVRVFRAKDVYFHHFYLPSMLLFLLQMTLQGWKKKAGYMDYACFLLGNALMCLSPFFLTLIIGYFQQARGQLVYPLTSAFFLAYLTVWPQTGFKTEFGKRWRISVFTVMTAACVFLTSRNALVTAQLFETAWEAYRNDVLTANRLYSDICQAANRSDMENCQVIFTGRRDAGVRGPATFGELSGLSFYEVEAWAPMGSTGRILGMFSLLGMDVLELYPALYDEAVYFMKDAPDWPAQGSIREMGDYIVVRLSE